MKKLTFFYSILIAVFITINFETNAQPRLGGEILWETTTSGAFIFTFNYYHNCRAGCCLSAGDSVLLKSNSTIGNVYLYKQNGYPLDISPQCASGSNLSHISCSIGSTSNNNGAVSETVYKSSPVFISGLPPITGWMFYIDLTASRPFSYNLSVPSLRCRSIMYPYGNQNANPAFDNSPKFNQRPIIIYNGGKEMNYQPWAVDIDYDSLCFDWALPLSNGGNAAIFSNGYSYTNPLPNLSQSNLNTPATMDSSTGDISYESYYPLNDGVVFYATQKVTSYRCGIKIAEIYRDLCFYIKDSVANERPVLITSSLLIDTVYYGQLVNYSIGVFDNGLQVNGDTQSYSLQYHGDMFGSYVPSSGGNPAHLSTTQGCLSPPCATLSPAFDNNNPIYNIGPMTYNISWQTPCNPIGMSCGAEKNKIRFSFKATDDYCPVPASNYKTIELFLDYMPTIDKPEILAINIINDTSIQIVWDSIIDNNLISYSLIYNDSLTLTTTTSNSYIYHLSSIVNANNKFYVIPNGVGCPEVDIHDYYSDSVSNVYLQSTIDADGVVYLNWNALRNDSSTQSSYNIYRKKAGQNWQRIATTQNEFFNDSTSLCYDTAWYKIGAYISLAAGISTLESNSNITYQYYMDIYPPAIPKIDSVIIDNISGDAHLYWRPEPNHNDSIFVIYKSMNLPFYPIDTVYGVAYYIDTSNSPSSLPSVSDYGISCIDNCGNHSMIGFYSSLQENISNSNIIVFPNPTQDFLTVKIIGIKVQGAKIFLYGSDSKLLYSQDIDMKKSKIDLTSFPTGVYYYQIENIKGETLKSGKVIKI